MYYLYALYRIVKVKPINMQKKHKKGLEFHISSGDYFITLATILNLIGDSTEKAASEISKNTHQIKKLKEDLMFLQEYYKINPK